MCIAINSALPEPWKRFVLAHEIGHLQLSVKGAGYFFLSEHSLMLPLVEREANLFAIEFLVGGKQPH
jgi:Zn-dependent peptidase ImmA (M78 family)